MTNKEIRKMIMDVYRNPDIIDDIACKNCKKKEKCSDIYGRHDCMQTDEEAVEAFIENYKKTIL